MTGPDIASLATRLQTGAAIPDTDRQWLASIVAKMEAGETITPPQAAPAKAHRDRLLRDLRRDHYPDLRPRPAAERIVTDLRRYEATAWRIDRHRPCPYPAGTQRALLWEILASGQPVLAVRRLIDILQFVQPDTVPIAQTQAHTDRDDRGIAHGFETSPCI